MQRREFQAGLKNVNFLKLVNSSKRHIDKLLVKITVSLINNYNAGKKPLTFCSVYMHIISVLLYIIILLVYICIYIIIPRIRL